MTPTLAHETLWPLLLAGTRVTAVVFTAPLLSHSSIPRKVKVAVAAMLTFSLAAGASQTPIPEHTLSAGVAFFREFAVGVTLGFAAGLVFAGFALMGEFIAIQGGLGAANVLDPTSGISTVVLTSLLQIFGLLVFMSIGGHHELIRALQHSFSVLPVGAPWPDAQAVAGELASLGSIVFSVAFRLAVPVVVAMLCSNLAVGILGRAIPQLNLIALQLPAHIAITLLLLGLGAGPLLETMSSYLEAGLGDARLLVSGGS